jgi:hypothetical protein
MNSKEQTFNIKKNSFYQKVDLENGNYFIEYFYSIGLDHDLIFDDFLYNNNLSVLNQSSKIQPKIISKYPQVNKKNINLDESTLIRVKP